MKKIQKLKGWFLSNYESLFSKKLNKNFCAKIFKSTITTKGISQNKTDKNLLSFSHSVKNRINPLFLKLSKKKSISKEHILFASIRETRGGLVSKIQQIKNFRLIPRASLGSNKVSQPQPFVNLSPLFVNSTNFILKKNLNHVHTKRRLLSNQETKVRKSIPNEGDAATVGQLSRTIVITSGKGGVGKTTATANLGMSIARLGYRVALIDADIGLRNLDLLLGLENRILYTAMDILEGQCRLDQALIRDKRWKNLSLLSISKNRQRYNVTRKNMENLVKSISSLGYHFILIDCPAGIDVGFINAIAPAEEALIITTPEITAIRDADRVAGLLEANGIYNVKLLVNRVRPDMIQRNDMMSVRDVQEMLGIPLLGAIPEDNHVIISTNRGEPLVLKKKLTLSGIAFENAARRLIGKQDYFIDLATPYKGVFQKVQELFFGL